VTTTETRPVPAPTKPARPRPSRMGRAPQDTPANIWHYLLLSVMFLFGVFPLYWMVVIATGTDADLAAIPPKVIPGSNLITNLNEVFCSEFPLATGTCDTGEVYFFAGLINSFVVSVVVTASVLFFCSLAGFAFAKLRFKGRNAMMLIVIGTMMVPPQLSVIPLYMMVAKLDWSDQLQAVILPSLVSAFGVFFMRQYLLQALPDEIIEAARVDGASSWRVIWHVVFPAARPAMAVLGMLMFVQTWNDFLWPFLVLTQNGNPTVQVAVAGLGRGYTPDQSLIMAGALLGTLPLLIVFAIFGKQIVGGIMQGAVKG
jgi:cellobiose transport system permease protein